MFQVYILRFINNEPERLAEFWSWLYLSNARTLYTLFSAFALMPLILHTPALWPVTSFLSNNFWIPFARLSYGAYLSHSIFMLFREFNSERGTWGSEFDAVLFFMAYLTMAFFFSLLITLTIESPIIRLYQEFTKLPSSSIKEAAALSSQGSFEEVEERHSDAVDIQRMDGSLTSETTNFGNNIYDSHRENESEVLC